MSPSVAVALAITVLALAALSAPVAVERRIAAMVNARRVEVVVPERKPCLGSYVTTLTFPHPAGFDSITTVSAIPPGSLVQIGTGWANDVEVRRTGGPFAPLVYPHMPGEPVVVLPDRVCEPLCACPGCGLFGHHLFGSAYSMAGGVPLIDRECQWCGVQWTEAL